MRRSFRLTPSENRIEGGVGDFLPLQVFNAALDKDNIVSFGLLIKGLLAQLHNKYFSTPDCLCYFLPLGTPLIALY